MPAPNQIFRLAPDYHPDRTIFESPAVTQDGLRLKHWDRNVKKGTLRYEGSKPLPDASMVGKTILFNANVRELAATMRIPSNILWVPVDLFNKQQHVSTWWTAICTDTVRVLDLDRSPHTVYPSSRVLSKVERWVIDPDRLPDADLFVGELAEWLVTSRFQEAFARSGFVGLTFLPCEMAS